MVSIYGMQHHKRDTPISIFCDLDLTFEGHQGKKSWPKIKGLSWYMSS